MRILADASLPGLDAAFPAPFILSRYSSRSELDNSLHDKDILLCRSTLKVNQALLKQHHLNFIATASSGIDHLDQPFLKAQNIQIIDAKGANAEAVADYVMACLAYLEQNHPLKGKSAGIIGMGHVGTSVSSRLRNANFQVMHYDPLKSLHHPQFKSTSLTELFNSDLLCIHAQWHNNFPYPSVNLINEAFLARLKPGCVIINASRGGIVNEEALLNCPNLIYCTDVYLNEPTIDYRVVDKATLCTPHIAGHSLEAKQAAIRLISERLHGLLDLPLPQFSTLDKPPFIAIDQNKCWQDRVLSIYNPAE